MYYHRVGLSAFSSVHVRRCPCVDPSPFSPGGWCLFILSLIVRLVCRKGIVFGGLITKDSNFMSDITVLPLNM